MDLPVPLLFNQQRSAPSLGSIPYCNVMMRCPSVLPVCLATSPEDLLFSPLISPPPPLSDRSRANPLSLLPSSHHPQHIFVQGQPSTFTTIILHTAFHLLHYLNLISITKMSVQIASYQHSSFHSIPSYAYQSTSSISFPTLPIPAAPSQQSTSSNAPVRQRIAPKTPSKPIQPTKSDNVPEPITSADNDNLRHYAFNPSPLSDIDNMAYEDLVRFEDDILRCGYSSGEELATLEESYTALQKRLEALLDEGLLSEHTLDLWVEVMDQAQDILADAVEAEEVLQVAQAEVAVSVTKAMEQMQSTAPSSQPEASEQHTVVKSAVVEPVAVPPRTSKSKATKTSKSTPPIASSSSASLCTPLPPPRAVPTLEQKMEIDEDTKSFRKRRIDIAVPGKESAKFQPLRAYFVQNIQSPYPSLEDKRMLADAAGIDESSVSQWFTNTRRRSGWGGIYKNIAKDKKEDMRILMKKTFGPEADPSFVLSADAQAAIDAMRAYLDKLARDDVDDTFTRVLQAANNKSREAKLRLYEEDRKTRIKPRKGVPVIKEEVVGEDSEPQAQAGKKRKRKVESEEPQLGQRSDWSVHPSQPTVNVRGSQSKFAVVSVKAEPIAPSLEPTPPPAKKARVTRKKQEKAPAPPKDLRRRRGGVADLRAPSLSACPTLVDLPTKHTSSSVDSMRSLASSSSSATLVSCPSLPLPPVESFHPVKMSVPASHVATNPSELSFECGQLPQSATVVSSAVSHGNSVTQFASTLPGPCEALAPIHVAHGMDDVVWDFFAANKDSSPSPSPEQNGASQAASENMDQHVQAWDSMQPQEWRAVGQEAPVPSGSGLPVPVQSESSYSQQWEASSENYAPIQQQQANTFGSQHYSYSQETQSLPSYTSYQSLPATQSFQQYEAFSTPTAEPMPPSYDEFMEAHPSQTPPESGLWISVPQSLAMQTPQAAPAYSVAPVEIYQSSLVSAMDFVAAAQSYTSALAGVMKIPEVNWAPQIGYVKHQYPQAAYAAALSTFQQGF
ncbi:hypothetical protein FRB95_005463 [Tulasnella sp. JGI-2019a]|nr:hypothetical protein FRB95_005463 [Tulasnella sp. JGI-2019a]